MLGQIRKRTAFLWLFIVCYFPAQVFLYGQDHAPSGSTLTPWDHLTLEGALVIAIGALSTVVTVQYRENRKKDQDWAAALARVTEVMVQQTEALERLSEKVEKCP